METYNYGRIKSMEALLDKNLQTLNKVTGMSDKDLEKLKEEPTNFNLEETWDRQRRKKGIE